MFKSFVRTVGIYWFILGLKIAKVFSLKPCAKEEMGYTCRHRVYVVNGITQKECGK